MKFGKCFALILALGFACGFAAQAQVGVYGMYSAQRLSGIPCLDPVGACSNTSSPDGKDTASGHAGDKNPLNMTGGLGGVYYDFKTYGPVRLGVDLRAGEGHSNKSATSSAGGAGASASQFILAGVRGSFHTPIKILKPYVQGSVGWNHSNVTEPFGTAELLSSSFTPPSRYDHFIQYEAFAGLDIHIFPVLDFRLAELGVGNMNRIGSNSTSTASSVGILSIGAGIVFHLP